MPNDYVFPGITQFVEAAAQARGVTCRATLGKCRDGWFYKRIVDVLGGVGVLNARVKAREVPPEAMEDLLANLRALQNASRVQADALDAAIAHALAGLGLGDGAETTTTTTNTKEAKRVSKQR